MKHGLRQGPILQREGIEGGDGKHAARCTTQRDERGNRGLLIERPERNFTLLERGLFLV